MPYDPKQYPDPHSSWFHTIDVETGGLPKNRAQLFSVRDFLNQSGPDVDFLSTPMGTYNRQVPLLQVYASNHPAFYTTRKKKAKGHAPESTFIRPSAGYADPRTGQFVSTPVGEWAKEQRIDFRSKSFGKQSEEEALALLYGGFDKTLARHEKLAIGGWNVQYDLINLESTVRRYDSLKKYHGYFHNLDKAKKLQVVQLEDPLFEIALQHGKNNPEFASRSLRMKSSGRIATTVEEMRSVPGWSSQNVVTRMAGGKEQISGRFGISDLFHDAFIDVQFESKVYDAFRRSLDKLQEPGADLTSILQSEMAMPDYRGKVSGGEFLEGIFESSWQKRFAREAESGAGLARLVEEAPKGIPYKSLGIAALALGGAAIAYGLAYGKRDDRQTQIEALRHGGLAEKERHKHTAFGSGWVGQQENPNIRTGLYLGAGAGLYGAHLWAHTKFPNYKNNVYKTFQKIEDKFPAHLFNMFRGSHLSSSYLLDSIHLSSEQLLHGGDLSHLGEHLNRLMGPRATIAERAKTGIHFKREDSSAYLRMEDSDFSVRWAEHKSSGDLTGSSFRLDREASQIPYRKPAAKSFLERWKQAKQGQDPFSPHKGVAVEGFEKEFMPLFSREKGKVFQAIEQRASIFSLNLIERPQRLLSAIGLGLKNTDWKNSSTLLAGLLFKRVLPAYLSYQALRYADDKLGNKPSLTVGGLVAKSHILWAEETDKVPGARAVTDWYKNHVPGSQYGPLALPLLGFSAVKTASWLGRITNHELPKSITGAKGALVGLAPMLLLLPGMLGSRKTAEQLRSEYEGDTPVPVRSGRWWNLGSTPLEGNRIQYYRPNWYARMKAKPYDAATYGSTDEKWRHSPLFHPLRWLRDPYWLERAHSGDRPYPITSPAFSGVPIIGPILAATIGKVFKPVKRMHEKEWDGTDYTVFSRRVEPKGPKALSNPKLREEYGFKDVVRREGEIAAEFVGMPGFLAKSLKNKIRPDNENRGKEIFFSSSRQLNNTSRLYYEGEYGAGLGVAPGHAGLEQFEFSEPLRRFIQRDPKRLEANELKNNMPSWLPTDYMVDLHKGDPMTKIAAGYMRLPGPGYETLHPHLKGVNYEDYPDLDKFRILADVAPYSKDFFNWKKKVGAEIGDDQTSRVEYEQILERVKKQKESSVHTNKIRFSSPVDQTTGTIKSVSLHGVELNELPGQKFSFSSIGVSGADMASIALRENNKLTKSEAAAEAARKQALAKDFLFDVLRPGTKVDLTAAPGTLAGGFNAPAVIVAGSRNINQDLLDQNLAVSKAADAGPEYQAMTSKFGKFVGKYAEEASGLHKSWWNPLNILPTPFHSKLWQERSAISQYQSQEVYGSRVQNWEQPIQKFVKPYFRGLVKRLTGRLIVPENVEKSRELSTLADQLKYLRSLTEGHKNETYRTAVGTDQSADARAIVNTIGGREKYYFDSFLRESDPDKQGRILASVSTEMARTLEAQWSSRSVNAARNRGETVSEIFEGGRLKTNKAYSEYEESKGDKQTSLNFGDWERSKEIAGLFFKRKLALPENANSSVYDSNIDYEDVKLKILEEEGYDYHDFNIFDDRASVLWRKPYIDGAVRELTAGNDSKTEEDLRKRVEKLIKSAHDRNPKARVVSQASRRDRTSVHVEIDENPDLRKDIRRNREDYENYEAEQ